MKDKFNLYDLLGYIVPGTLVCILLILFFNRVLGISSLTLESFQSFGESLIFLIVAYFVGQLVQARANVVEEKEIRSWGGWFSQQFLRDSDGHYGTDFKKKLKNSIKEYFDIDVSAKESGDKEYQEAFNLCYSLIVQKGAAQHTEIHNGIYSLYRGFIVTCQLGVLLFSIELAKHISIIGFKWIVLRHFPMSEYGLEGVLVSFIFILLFLGGLTYSKKRLKRFGRRFADSVYRNFYVYYISWKKEK